MTRSRQTADWGSRAGLAKIVPSSVAVGSGTGSANTLGTVTFSGASSVSLNNVFSATYQNYRIVISGNNVTATNQLRMRVRVAGVDNSAASNYLVAGEQITTTGSSAISNSTGSTSWHIAEFYRRASLVIVDITNPFATDYTTMNFTGYGGDSSTTQYYYNGGGSMTVTTSYDGFTIFPDVNTITGTVSIYGYNN